MLAIGKRKKVSSKERGIMVRGVVPPRIEKKLKEMAAKENRTLSNLVALILTRAVEDK